MPVGCECADRTNQPALGQHGQESQPDERGRFQTAGGVVVMVRQDRIIESRDLLMQLRTDATDQLVPEARHAPQANRRAVLHAPVGLGKRRQSHVALVHGRLTSARLYSGSASPSARARPKPARSDHCARSPSIEGDTTVTRRRALPGSSNDSSKTIDWPSKWAFRGPCSQLRPDGRATASSGLPALILSGQDGLTTHPSSAAGRDSDQGRSG